MSLDEVKGLDDNVDTNKAFFYTGMLVFLMGSNIPTIVLTYFLMLKLYIENLERCHGIFCIDCKLNPLLVAL